MHNRFSLRLALALFIIFLITVSFSFALIFSSASAQTSNSPDVIAVRVVPNLNHYSPSRWYSEQGFEGAPQSLLVDGYEAVRDGRTVYVDVGNVDFATDKFYTNIYIISFNQEAEQPTIDILGQLISFWKFNTNVLELGGLGSCLDPNQENGDTEQKCFLDKDCAAGNYCSSLKSDIIRDTKRLADLADIKMYLANYRGIYGYYPILGSGTYLQHKTISVWPSWQNTFSLELGRSSLPMDPINHLGGCQACCQLPLTDLASCSGSSICDSKYNFNSVTCWDEVNKFFADPLPENEEFDLPKGSNVFVYEVSSDGYNYYICAVMDSGYINSLEEGACDGSGDTDDNQISNNPPVISCPNLTAYPGEYFQGYISIYDLDTNDKISEYTIEKDGTIWVNWPAELEIEADQLNKSKFRIFSNIAGSMGDYYLYVNATDSRGEETTQRCKIKVKPGLPIIYDLPDQIVMRGDPLEFKILASEPARQYPLSFVFTNNLIAPGDAPSCNGPDTGVTADGRYYLCHVKMPSVNYNMGNYDFQVKVTDTAGDYINESFTLSVVASIPIMNDLTCSSQVRWGSAYSCSGISAIPYGSYTITSYQAENLPAGISITTSATSPKTATISGTPGLSAVGEYEVEVVAVDSAGSQSLPAIYDLRVVSYCQDGVWQNPNTEGSGGVNNIGDEQCDGTSNVATTPAQSSASKQYGCTSNCIFTGGYCGDGITQTAKGEQCDGGSNCTNECAFVAPPPPACPNTIKETGEACECTTAVSSCVYPNFIGSCGGIGSKCENCQCVAGYDPATDCGDGVKQSGYEECDDAIVGTQNFGFAICDDCVDCECVRCGDHAVEGEEECEFSSTGSPMGCADCDEETCKCTECGDALPVGDEVCECVQVANSEASAGTDCTIGDADNSDTIRLPDDVNGPLEYPNPLSGKMRCLNCDVIYCGDAVKGTGEGCDCKTKEDRDCSYTDGYVGSCSISAPGDYKCVNCACVNSPVINNCIFDNIASIFDSCIIAP